MTRIQNPGRSSSCKHVQPFDLGNFLEINHGFGDFKVGLTLFNYCSVQFVITFCELTTCDSAYSLHPSLQILELQEMKK
jgi:hypothetical protein